MSILWRDLKFGAVLLAKSPAYAAVAVATLALAIGANTAIFSVVHAVLLAPLPFPEPERLVTLYNVYPGVSVEKGSNGVPDYLDRRQETAAFDSVALLAFGSANLSGGDGRPERVLSMRVTPSLFTVLRTAPAIGRAFTAEEATLGKERVAILTDDLWRRLFAADPGVLFRTIRINGVEHGIVGVLPAGFDLFSIEAELLTPFAFTEEQMADDARHSNFAMMVARLAPGVTVAQAQGRIDDLNRRNLERFPEYRELLENVGFATRVVPLREEMTEEVRPALWMLQAGVALVLLIGCVNVASLSLVRSEGRWKEMAMRLALGAGRGRLVRQLLTESVLLALAGAVAGLGVAVAALALLRRIGLEELPRSAAVHLDGTVLAFTAGLAIATGLAFGLAPVAKVFGGDLQDVFREGGRSGTGGRKAVAVRTGLVVGQVALAFLLLIAAGLTLASFRNVLEIDPGFRADGVLTAHLTLPESRYADDAQIHAFAARAAEAVAALPGVEAAGLTSMLPFLGDANASVIAVEGHVPEPGESPPVPHFNVVDGGYFAALEIPLLAGRTFTGGDASGAPPVAVIDRHLADRFWPQGDPLGRRLLRGLPGDDNDSPWYTIVGVVDAVTIGKLGEPDTVGTVYFSNRQMAPRQMSVALRTKLPETQMVPSLRQAILAIDPELPLFDPKPLRRRIDDSLARRRAPMVLLAVFAGLALTLSAVGVYGVLAYAVRRRTREIGIRVALGAQREQVLGQVLRQGLAIVGAGLLLGLAGALAGSRLLASQLYGIGPNDPSVFIAVSLLLAAAAVAACLLPSLRATRIDPLEALRIE